MSDTPGALYAEAGAGNLRPVGVIARLTLREAQRRKMLWLGLGLGLAFVALFATGYYFAFADFQRQVARSPLLTREIDLFHSMFLVAGLYVVNFLIVMITALTSVGSISSEIDSDTIHAIAAKPIRRWQIVLGKWVGHALLAMLYSTLLAAGVMAAVYIISGYAVARPLSVLLILILESLTVLSLTLMGSALFNTLANGVAVFMLYGLAFVGGWVEQIGSVLESQTAVDVGIASSLLMPSEALWRYASGLMQSGSSLQMPVSPFSVTSQPTPAMVIYAGVYVLALLGGAMWAFSQRDF